MNKVNKKITLPTDKTIIVIDDDQAVRDSLAVMLSLAGFQVATCESGAGLFRLLESSKPDCLVLDLHMPGMTGLDIVEHLNAANADIPVILVSGNMDAATEAQARSLGVSHLLNKPFSGAVLIEIVKGIVGAP